MVMRMVELTTGPLEVLDDGEGPAVVLWPSLGRGAVDFQRLSGDLVQHGYRAVAVNQRGVGESALDPNDNSMHVRAAVVGELIDELGLGRAHLVGHAACKRERQRKEQCEQAASLVAS